MFKTCSDPDFNWVHCLCDSATWVVKEPGKPIGFFYSRLFDDALSPSGLGFAVDAFRIDEDGTLDDFYSDILWDYGAADELIAAYPIWCALDRLCRRCGFAHWHARLCGVPWLLHAG